MSSNKDLKKISRYLGKVLYEQKRNNDEIAELHRLYKKPSNQDTPPPKMDQLPVKNLSDLKSFEESLADVNVVKGLVGLKLFDDRSLALQCYSLF